MADLFAGRPTQLADPASNAALITGNDSTDLSFTLRAICWDAGTVKVTTVGGQTLILPAHLASQVIPLRIVRVWATSTSATSIVGLW